MICEKENVVSPNMIRRLSMHDAARLSYGKHISRESSTVDVDLPLNPNFKFFFIFKKFGLRLYACKQCMMALTGNIKGRTL